MSVGSNSPQYFIMAPPHKQGQGRHKGMQILSSMTAFKAVCTTDWAVSAVAAAQVCIFKQRYYNIMIAGKRIRLDVPSSQPLLSSSDATRHGDTWLRAVTYAYTLMNNSQPWHHMEPTLRSCDAQRASQCFYQELFSSGNEVTHPLAVLSNNT